MRLREHFDIIVNEVARDFGSKDKSKTQMQAYSMIEP